MIGSDEVVAVICGGVGAARLLNGLQRQIPGPELMAIANVGDDFELHGLHISPDLDTIVYTCADAVSQERGWGLEGETWKAMETLARYEGEDWFSLGDRDLGTHLYRTHRLRAGVPLSTVSAEIARGWGIGFTLMPVTNNRLRTMVTPVGNEAEITFQEYFVKRSHDVDVEAVRFEGADASHPAEGVEAALEVAQRIVIAPSNPIVSIDPVLAVPGVRAILKARRDRVVAVSPIVGGEALKGPAARLMRNLGHVPSAVGVAAHYADICSTLVVDTADADLREEVEQTGVACVVTDTIMSEPGVLQRLSETVLG